MNKEAISIIAVLANFMLTLFKIFIGLISMSSSILADGVHSGMDIVSSGISYFGIKASKKPLDKKHPYGHYKSESVSGFIITFILFLSSIWIIYEGVMDFFTPKTIVVSYLAIGVMAFSGCINEIMARLKFKYGKIYESMSLMADATHSRIDVLTSIGVLLGLLASTYWIYTDSLVAVLIGTYVMWSSIKLGRETTDSLLDVSAGEEIENKIRSIVKSEGIVLSNLKTQKLGPKVFAELTIELDPNITVESASKISRDLESRLIKAISKLNYVVIQIKSHKIKESYYKEKFSKGFGWRKGFGLGPGGECICTKCGYKTPHKKGTPCYKQLCPKCGGRMTRYKGGGKYG